MTEPETDITALIDELVDDLGGSWLARDIERELQR